MTKYTIQKMDRVAYTAEILPAIIEFVIDYKRRHDGLSPTARELQAAFDIRSLSTVATLLDELVENGALMPIERNGRVVSYRVSGGKWVHNNEA